MCHCLVMAEKIAHLPFIVNKLITNQGVTPTLPVKFYFFIDILTDYENIAKITGYNCLITGST